MLTLSAILYLYKQPEVRVINAAFWVVLSLMDATIVLALIALWR